MAAYNFTLAGLSASVELGKGGSRVKESAGVLQARNFSDLAFVEGQGADATVDDSWVTYRQFQNALNGLNWKQVVVVATTSPGTLASSFENGDVVDGVTLATGNRILIKDQASGVENGIYIVNATGAPTRAADMAAGAAAANYAMFISQGTANADTAWVCTDNAGSDIVGTDALTFAQFSTVVSGITTIALAGGAVGQSPIVSGTGPTATLKGFVGGTGIDTSTVGTDIDIGITAGGVGTAELADDAVTEAKLNQGVGVLYRRIQVTFAGWPAATGTNTINLGGALPTGAIVLGSKVIVTTVFNNGALADIGNSTLIDAVQDQTEINLEVGGTYVADRGSNQSAVQLIVTRETLAAAPTAGVAEVVVSFLNPA